MKNRAVNLLLALTLLFVGITVGFSWGKNTSRAPVIISATPQETQTVNTTNASTTVNVIATTDDEDIQKTDSPGKNASPFTGPVDINTADLDALMTLPGIGEELARRILDYRQENGNFQSLEDLTNVNGIGTKRLEAILDYATAGG